MKIGVSWSDFTSISIYAKSSKWVIGSADFSGLVTASPTGASPTGTETANPLTAKSASSSLTTNLGIAVVMGIIIYRLRV